MKEATGVNRKQIVLLAFKVAILALSLVGAVKMIFFGLVVDEEYAVVMSYRMVSGDAMLWDMWEPHQTSGFVCAIFIKLFLMLFGSTEYLLIYLRIVGVILQLAVSLFVYDTIRKIYDKEIAFWAGIMCFSLLPKWIQTPEFANILLWSNLCTMMCLLRYARVEKGRKRWLILAAVFYCCAILAYPTCLLLLPVYLYGIYRCVASEGKKNIGVFLGTCVVIGSAYVGYFLLRRGFQDFLFGVSQMMTDGEHKATLWQRMGIYGNELLELLPEILLVLSVTIVSYLLITKLVLKRKDGEGKLLFLCLLVLVSHIQQLWAWNSMVTHVNEPLLFYYFTFLAGILLAKKKDELFWFGLLPAGVTVLAVLLITNTTISVTGTNLLPGILAGGIVLREYIKEKKLSLPYQYVGIGLALVSMGLLLFAKGCVVCENEGAKANIFYVKQKVLYGPAKGIYCRYLDGYHFNNLEEVVDAYVSDKDVVLCVGNHSLRYMVSDGEIGTYSTISTPTYDERLLDYWEMFPERYPSIVIAEENTKYMEQVKKLLSLSTPIAEGEGYYIYRVIQ